MYKKELRGQDLVIGNISYQGIGFNILEGDSIVVKRKHVYLIFKRIMDLLFSSIGLVMLLPLYLFIGIIIKTTSKGKILYKHKRIGKDGVYIYLYKFRTMVSDAENISKYFTAEQMEEYERNYKLHNDPRITKIGKFLRKTSLDELPQLLNILNGEMSLIGPRPVVDVEIDKYGLNKKRFLSVKPGLTGWWACNGRSAITYEDRINLELYYVYNFSLILDVKCFFKTIIAVFKGNNAE